MASGASVASGVPFNCVAVLSEGGRLKRVGRLVSAKDMSPRLQGWAAFAPLRYLARAARCAL